MLLLLILLVLLFGGFGIHQGWGTPYGYSGISLSTILLIVLIVMLLRGNL